MGVALLQLLVVFSNLRFFCEIKLNFSHQKETKILSAYKWSFGASMLFILADCNPHFFYFDPAGVMRYWPCFLTGIFRSDDDIDESLVRMNFIYIFWVDLFHLISMVHVVVHVCAWSIKDCVLFPQATELQGQNNSRFAEIFLLYYNALNADCLFFWLVMFSSCNVVVHIIVAAQTESTFTALRNNWWLFWCRHQLEILLGDHLLPYNMTVYQAIKQFAQVIIKTCLR